MGPSDLCGRCSGIVLIITTLPYASVWMPVWYIEWTYDQSLPSLVEKNPRITSHSFPQLLKGKYQTLWQHETTGDVMNAYECFTSWAPGSGAPDVGANVDEENLCHRKCLGCTVQLQRCAKMIWKVEKHGVNVVWTPSSFQFKLHQISKQNCWDMQLNHGLNIPANNGPRLVQIF